jgi:hypothetical protein
MALDKSKFQKPAGAKPANASGGAKSRWAGMRSAKPKDPFPEPGIYRFRVDGIERGFNPGKNRESIKTHLAVVDLDEQGAQAHAEGDSLFMVNFLTSAGMSEFQAFVTAAAGFEDDDGFVAEHGDDGSFVDGVVNGSGALDGKLVDCQVTRGKQAADGSYYPRYAWSPVTD